MKIITSEEYLVPVIESLVENYKAFTDIEVSKELKIVVSENIKADSLLYSSITDKNALLSN